ncbi:MAG: hypothetical protein GEU80_11865 [Dehalococcoidia bacterium]|nr:hypothetical protein [Dehalococcoidia bacterium]
MTERDPATPASAGSSGDALPAPPGQAVSRRAVPSGPPAPLVVLTVLVTLSFLMFLLIEPTPRWLLLFTAVVALLGADGTLRTLRRRHFEAAQTAPYLFLPALYVLATPIVIEHNVRGFLVAPAGVLAGVAFGAIVAAEVASVRMRSAEYANARLVATAAVYFVAFSMFSLTYIFELSLLPAAIACALIAAMLAVELLREGEVDPVETLVFSAVTGMVVAEVRWMLHYIPVDGYLAGLTLLLAFFFVTGMLQSHLTRQLSAVVAAEYAVIVALGLGVVVAARSAGIA